MRRLAQAQAFSSHAKVHDAERTHRHTWLAWYMSGRAKQEDASVSEDTG